MSPTGPRLQAGFTLIELMIVLVISLIMSLAIFGVLASSEGIKRTMTATNDTDQAGSYAGLQLERILRSAGSGFAKSAPAALGCQLAAQQSGTTLLPFSGTMAAPFSSINSTLSGVYRLASVVIAKGGTTPNVSAASSDVLIVMTGNSTYGIAPVTFSSGALASALNLLNTEGFSANDLVLVAGTSSCAVQQVSSSFVGSLLGSTVLTLGGSYAANPTAGVDITSGSAFGASSQAINLGNPNGTMPVFQLIGVGNNNVLYSYDFLQATLLPIADSVFELHALYGVDTVGDGLVHTWIDPGTAGYDVATLESGTAASISTLQNIKAIRLGLILRTNQPSTTSTSGVPTSVTLFSDLGASLTYTRTFSGGNAAGINETLYRYRTVDITIPIRNALL